MVTKAYTLTPKYVIGHCLLMETVTHGRRTGVPYTRPVANRVEQTAPIARSPQHVRHHSSRRRRIEHTHDASALRTVQPNANAGLKMQELRMIVPMDYNAPGRKAGPADRAGKTRP